MHRTSGRSVSLHLRSRLNALFLMYSVSTVYVSSVAMVITVNHHSFGFNPLFKVVMNCLCFLFCTVLWGPLTMLSKCLHKKHHNLEVIIYFLSCFDPPHHCVCLTAFIFHRCTLQWFRLKKVFNLQCFSVFAACICFCCESICSTCVVKVMKVFS